MNLYFTSMIMVILSNILYHISSKAIPSDVNLVVSLIVTYGTALVLSVIILFVFPIGGGRIGLFKEVNWASYALGCSVVALEMGFLLAYRSGWNVSTAALYAQVIVSILLIPVGLIFFKEHLSFRNVIGIAISIIGVILIAKK